MPAFTEIESLMPSARRIDVDDQSQISAVCAEHAIAESKLQAMVDVFRPLTSSFAVFVTD